MTKVTIEAPINVIPIGQEKTYYFFELFVLWAINGDRRFNGDGPGIRASMRIETELSKLPAIRIERKEGDPEQDPRVLVLKKEDQLLLLATLTEPQQLNGQGYQITPARVLLPWIDAVEHAVPIED